MGNGMANLSGYYDTPYQRALSGIYGQSEQLNRGCSAEGRLACRVNPEKAAKLG